MIANKADGKIVQFPGNSSEDSPTQTVGKEKIEAISLEYSQLLTSQLESQRLYYHEQMLSVTTRN